MQRPTVTSASPTKLDGDGAVRPLRGSSATLSDGSGGGGGEPQADDEGRGRRSTGSS